MAYVTNSCSERIKVYLRVKPENTLDLKTTGKYITSDDTVKLTNKHGFQKCFKFDHIFNSNTTQDEIFTTVGQQVLNEALEGLNSTLFLYGASGTGKTYTIFGNQSLHGLAYIIGSTAFQQLKAEGLKFDFKISFLEVYREDIYDLLCPRLVANKLKLYDDGNTCIVKNLTELQVKCLEDIRTSLKKGLSWRQRAATLVNDRSSRSHAVLQLTLKIDESVEKGVVKQRIGKINLIDLAGAECISKCVAASSAQDTGSINKSLLTLGRVIGALVEKSTYVPYRESKLTRVLADSLGGETTTRFITTISLKKENLESTYSTLTNVSEINKIFNKPQQKHIVVKPKVLVTQHNTTATLLPKEIPADEDLRQQVENLNQEVKSQAEEIQYLQRVLKEKEHEIKMQKQTIAAQEEKLESILKMQNGDKKCQGTQTMMVPVQSEIDQTITPSSNAGVSKTRNGTKRKNTPKTPKGDSDTDSEDKENDLSYQQQQSKTPTKALSDIVHLFMSEMWTNEQMRYRVLQRRTKNGECTVATPEKLLTVVERTLEEVHRKGMPPPLNSVIREIIAHKFANMRKLQKS